MTIQDVIDIVLRRWWIALLAVALGAGVGYAYESSKPERFATDARVLIGPSLEEGGDPLESTGALTRGTLQQTLAELVTGSEVRRAAAGTVADVSTFQITGTVVPEANVVNVAVEGPEPEAVLALAEIVVEEAERSFEARYPFYDVSLIDAPTEPESPISPNPDLGAVAGALLAAAIVVIALVFVDQRRPASERALARAGKAPPVPALGSYNGATLVDRRRPEPSADGAEAADRAAPVAPMAPVPDRDAEPDDAEPDDAEPDDAEPDDAEPPADGLPVDWSTIRTDAWLDVVTRPRTPEQSRDLPAGAEDGTPPHPVEDPPGPHDRTAG